MKKIALLSVLAGGVFLTGCATASTPAGMGLIYTDAKIPVTATSNKNGKKVGKAVCTNILGWVLQGDCSVEAAAKNGNISEITKVDAHAKSILGIYGTYETIVTGN
jgi:hypothetical protein